MRITGTHRKKLSRVLRRNKKIRAAFLFGSQATGSVRPTSDVDIGILFEHGEDDKISGRTLALAGEMMRTLERNDVDVVELNRASTLLRYAAIVHGKPLFVRRKNELPEITFRVLGEFEDFRPYLERQQARLKKRLSKL